jgi:hypothetical protein
MPGGFPVAPEATNSLRALPVRFCALNYDIPVEPEAHKGHPPPSRIDPIFKALTVELLKDAYVILIPYPNEQEPTPKPFLARTNGVGQLVKTEESKLKNAPSNAREDTILLSPRRSYHYFWTRRGDLCGKIWKQVKTNPVSAMAENPFYVLRTEEQAHGPTFHKLGLKDPHHPKLGLVLSPPDGPGKDEAGFSIWQSWLYCGADLSAFEPKGGATEATASYAIARSYSTATLFLADLISALAGDIMGKTAEARGTLDGVRDLAMKATKAESVEELQEELLRGEFYGYFCRGDWHKAYYPYAHRCAKKRVPRDLFAEAVDVSWDSKAWEPAAIKIMYDYSIPHPDYPNPQKTEDKKHSSTNIWRVEVAPVLKIFDFYTFGIANSSADWNVALPGVKTKLGQKLRNLSQLGGQLLKKTSSYLRFFQELDAQCLDDFEQRRQMHDRYLEMAAAHEYRWWEEFNEGFFSRIKPYSDWLSTSSSKLADLLNHHFGQPEELLKFNNLLKENVTEFERMFAKMEDFDNHFGGKKIDRKLPDGTKFEVDFANNKVTIRPPAGEGEEVGPLFFTTRASTESTRVLDEDQLLKNNRYRVKKLPVKPGTKSVTVPELPLKKIHKLPVWLGAFGDSLSLAVGLSQLGKELEKANEVGEKIEVLGKTAGSVLSAMSSLTDAINFTFICTTKIPWILAKANPASKLIEVFFNVKEGFHLLYSDESEIASALEKGDVIDGVLLTTKGAVLWCSVVPGAVNFGVAILTTMALGEVLVPLAIGLAVGGIIISGIDLIRYLRNGPENAMDPVAEKLKDAIKEELKGHGYSRTVDMLSSLHEPWRKLLGPISA